MITREKLEGYLVELSLDYESKGDGLWVLSGSERGLETVVLMMADPVVVLQVKVMSLPEKRTGELCEKLLRFNASDLIYGAYAIQDEEVVMLNTLQGDTLDLEELRATIDAMGLALSEHYDYLSQYRS